MMETWLNGWMEAQFDERKKVTKDDELINGLMDGWLCKKGWMNDGYMNSWMDC